MKKDEREGYRPNGWPMWDACGICTNLYRPTHMNL